MEYLRIVPGKYADGTASIVCQGTKVLMPDGQEVPAIRRIVLVGEVDNVWSATIECVVRGPDITALNDTERKWAKPRSRLHYWLARLLDKVP